MARHALRNPQSSEKPACPGGRGNGAHPVQHPNCPAGSPERACMRPGPARQALTRPLLAPWRSAPSLPRERQEGKGEAAAAAGCGSGIPPWPRRLSAERGQDCGWGALLRDAGRDSPSSGRGGPSRARPAGAEGRSWATNGAARTGTRTRDRNPGGQLFKSSPAPAPLPNGGRDFWAFSWHGDLRTPAGALLFSSGCCQKLKSSAGRREWTSTAIWLFSGALRLPWFAGRAPVLLTQSGE